MKSSLEECRLLEEDSLSQTRGAMCNSTKSIPLWYRSTCVTALIAALVVSLSVNLFTGIAYLQARQTQTTTVKETSPFGAHVWRLSK